MKFAGVIDGLENAQKDLTVEKVGTLPAFTAPDEGKILHVTGGGQGWYGGVGAPTSAFVRLDGSGFFTDGTTYLAVGKGSPAPSYSGSYADSFVHGSGSSILGDNTFACGNDNDVVSADSFSQGRGNDIYANNQYSFTQGRDNKIGPYAPSSFAQGQGNIVGNNADFSLAQGNLNTVTAGAQHCFAQGRSNTIYGSSGYSFVQGHLNRVYATSPYCFAQGRYNDIGDTAFCGFAQGYLNTINSNADYCLVQGQNNVIGSARNQAFAQGRDNEIKGTDTFAQGFSNYVYGNECFIQGNDNSIGTYSNQSFAQGNSCDIAASSPRSFVQGNLAQSIRADQKTWGSNRATLLGGAQFSKIIKHLTTTVRTIATVLTFPLEEDKAYAIRLIMVGRNTDVDDEVATFILAQATAYRDSGGAAVLVGDPVSLTKQVAGPDPGPDNAAFVATLVTSTNDLLVRVTPDPGEAVDDDYQWTLCFEFAEVEG